MATKFFNRFTIVRTTRCEEGVSYDVPSDTEFRVRALGRGRWLVDTAGHGWPRVMRTAELQRLIDRQRCRYIGDYWTSGEPKYFVSEVYIDRA